MLGLLRFALISQTDTQSAPLWCEVNWQYWGKEPVALRGHEMNWAWLFYWPVVTQIYPVPNMLVSHLVFFESQEERGQWAFNMLIGIIAQPIIFGTQKKLSVPDMAAQKKRGVGNNKEAWKWTSRRELRNSLRACSVLSNAVSFWARILEWVAISSSRGSFPPRDGTRVSCISCIVRQIFYSWATREALEEVIA